MRILLRALVLWVFLAAALCGQVVNMARSACRGNAVRIYAELPIVGAADSSFSSITMVPVCLQLGGALQIDATTVPPTLTTAPVQGPTPWLAMDRIDLTSLPASTGATLTWTLGQLPMDGSALLAVLQGRPYGLVEATVVSGRQVSITLPARPFSAGDVVVLVYLTLDARPVPTSRR